MRSLMVVLFVVLAVSFASANELHNGGFDDGSWWTGQGQSGVAGGIGYVGSTAGNGAQLYQITYNAVFVEAPNYLIEARVRTAQSSDGLWGSGVAVEMYAYGWTYVGSLTYMFDEAEKAAGMNVWHDIAMEIDTSGWTQAAFDGWGVTASLRREGYAASGMVEFDSVSMTPIPEPTTMVLLAFGGLLLRRKHV